MLKNIIAPVQAWLLIQGKCVGCGKKLPIQTGAGLVKVTCECGRMYMLDVASGKYRRATLDEVR
jgi:hypothetical protein